LESTVDTTPLAPFLAPTGNTIRRDLFWAATVSITLRVPSSARTGDITVAANLLVWTAAIIPEDYLLG
jgi:hypothetical protein